MFYSLLFNSVYKHYVLFLMKNLYILVFLILLNPGPQTCTSLRICQPFNGCIFYCLLCLIFPVSEEELMQFCAQPCGQMLTCNHPCSGSCKECMQGRIHKVCDQPCNNVLICGHRQVFLFFTFHYVRTVKVGAWSLRRSTQSIKN